MIGDASSSYRAFLLAEGSAGVQPLSCLESHSAVTAVLSVSLFRRDLLHRAPARTPSAVKSTLQQCRNQLEQQLRPVHWQDAALVASVSGPGGLERDSSCMRSGPRAQVPDGRCPRKMSLTFHKSSTDGKLCECVRRILLAMLSERLRATVSLRRKHLQPRTACQP